MTKQQFLALFMLSGVWGASFLFMKVTVPAFGPIFLVEMRLLIAGLALIFYALLCRQPFNLKSKWKEYLILGAINAGIPWFLICFAELTLSSSMASILNATTPLFAAILGILLLKEKNNAVTFGGIGLGLFGVVILVGWSPFPITEKVIISILASLLAAFFYGIGGVYSKLAFTSEKPLELAIGQQMGGAIVLLPFSLFSIPARAPDIAELSALLGLALISTSIGYLLYFYLIRNVGPTKTVSVTMLVPVFGMIWGALFLEETLNWGLLIGLLIVLSSILLITNSRHGKSGLEGKKAG